MTHPNPTQPGLTPVAGLLKPLPGDPWRGHSCLPHRHSCRCPALAPFFPPEVQ